MSVLTVKLVKARERLEKEVSRKDEIDKPSKPEGSISYEDAKKLKKQEQQYEYKVSNIQKRIKDHNKDIAKLEKKIKDVIPTEDASITVTGKYDKQPYEYSVKYDSSKGEVIIS